MFRSILMVSAIAVMSCAAQADDPRVRPESVVAAQPVAAQPVAAVAEAAQLSPLERAARQRDAERRGDGRGLSPADALDRSVRAESRRSRPSPGKATLRVGPKRHYRTPSEAARVARDGDTVEIDAGTYTGDVAVWHAHDLTIRGVGGRPHLVADGQAAEGKAIWVIKGDNTTVENVEFSGARVTDRNGAGIRLEGAGLTIRRGYFHDNQNGLLTGNGKNSDILIEHCEFASNGAGDGLSHNIYVGQVRQLTVRYSYLHHARVGHNLKSRAATNMITYNRLMDERDGTSSYALDLPNGGASYVIGNLIQQGANTNNWAVINFGSRDGHAANWLYLVNNTVVSDRSSAVFVQNKSVAPVLAINNIFAGKGTVIQGTGILKSNLIARSSRDESPSLLDWVRGRTGTRQGEGEFVTNVITDHPDFVDPLRFDYRLRPGSLAIDAGTDPGEGDGVSLKPVSQYAHPASSASRPAAGPLDLGALEAAPPAAGAGKNE